MTNLSSAALLEVNRAIRAAGYRAMAEAWIESALDTPSDRAGVVLACAMASILAEHAEAASTRGIVLDSDTWVGSVAIG